MFTAAVSAMGSSAIANTAIRKVPRQARKAIITAARPAASGMWP